MIFWFLSFLIPITTTIGFTYTNFSDYYNTSGELLLFLCAFAAAVSVFITAPAKPVHRFLFLFTPFMIVYCLTHNFIVCIMLFALTFMAGLLLPKKVRRTKILFTHDNKPVFINFYRTLSPRKVCARLWAYTGVVMAVLFVLSCVFTTPGHIWGIRAYPIDLTQKPIYASSAVPNGNVTCTVGYDTNAIYIASFLDIESENGTVLSPAAAAGLRVGDVITKINGQNAKKSDFITKGPDGSQAAITVVRFNSDSTVENLEFYITPVYSASEGKYMIGIAFYDGHAIGMYSTVQTVAFTYPDKGYFAATAHSSEGAVPEDGEYVHILSTAHVNGRDEEGLTATAVEAVGEVLVMNDYGTFGTWQVDNTETLPIARKDEIKLGRATILSDFAGNGVKEYECYVTGTYRIGNRDVMCLIVTDDEIIEAGGITRGMSGSTVIQNGKIVGALSNTDERGYCAYATFACDMAHEIYLIQDELSKEERK